ncbi:hypothetical protein ASF30_10470 [Leifsonia sp. Leaf264]|nr:hypothetical protein ASF30_10470 [Leifsonia sp. Leaf264]
MAPPVAAAPVIPEPVYAAPAPVAPTYAAPTAPAQPAPAYVHTYEDGPALVPPAPQAPTLQPPAAGLPTTPPPMPPVAPPAAPSAPLTGSNYNFYNEGKDAAHGKNTFANNALLLPILGVVMIIASNFLAPILSTIGVLATIAGFVFAILGIRRANRTGRGKGKAITGLIIAPLILIVGLGVVLTQAIVSNPEFQEGFSAGMNADLVEQIEGNIKTDMTAQFVAQGIAAMPTAVDCPADTGLASGTELVCTATFDDATTQPVNVTITDDKAGFTWELQAQ